MRAIDVIGQLTDFHPGEFPMTTETQIERRVFMPNGRRETDLYNPEWCKERHEKIDQALENIRIEKEKKFDGVWDAIRRQYGLLWGILAGQLVIMGGIIAVLVT